MNKVHAEIEYNREDGAAVHSDICPPDCTLTDPDIPLTNGGTYREFLHMCLDEWLDKGKGTGQFYICNEGFTGFGGD